MKKIAHHKFIVRTTSLASRRNKNRKKKLRLELMVQTFWDNRQFKLSFYSDVCTQLKKYFLNIVYKTKMNNTIVLTLEQTLIYIQVQ